MRSNFTGVGSYNSEYRGFNRGLGRGHPKSFQSSERPPSSQPTRKGDIFLEAGRLAVEYLVSNGLLSTNVISGKFQNGTFRNSSGEFRDRQGSQHREIIPNSRVDGRPIGSARQGAVSPDGVSGTRRAPNDEDPRMSRNYFGERRRFGASRSYSSDWSRESGREGSFSDKVNASQRMDDENNKFVKGNSKEAYVDVRNSNEVESASEDDKCSEMQVEMEKSNHVDLVPNTTSSLQNKDGKELPLTSDSMSNEHETIKDGSSNHDSGKETPKNELVDQHCEDKNDNSSKDGVDLLKLCTSAKIPTKVRSSLLNKSPKPDPPLISEEKNENRLNSIAPMKAETLNISSVAQSSNEIHSLRDTGDQNPLYAVTKPKLAESSPFTGKTLSCEQKSDGFPELGRCSSAAEDRGEKRACEEVKIGEGAKKAKQWLSVSQVDDFSKLSDLSEKQSISLAKRVIPPTILNEGTNQENIGNMLPPLKASGALAKEQRVEKQLFSNSFKICDLNLMEASDMHDNRDMSVLIYPSISAPSKSSIVGIDLAMNNSSSLTSSTNDPGPVRKDIEIIDLESGNLPEGESMNALAQNLVADITNAGSFQNSSRNNHNSVDHDGYGCMISELLGHDVSSCSSVQQDMNSLQNEMGVHESGMFGEDDPIYMSLGDIPLSLLRDWDQQPQERNPFEM